MSELSRLPFPLPEDHFPPLASAAWPGPAGHEEHAEFFGVPITHYLWIVRRNLWGIAAFVFAAVLMTFIISERLPRMYEATATVDVDRQAPSAVVGQEASASAPNDADQFLSTQVRIIESDAVLRPVAEKFHLLDSQLASITPENASAVRRAPINLGGLRITRPLNTYLLLISYRSTNPELAADVANAIANSYVEHTYDIRIRSSASLSSFMEKELEELRAKMERSGEALSVYERELNVINPDEKTNILSARLLQLNQEYTSAQADRVSKEAAYKALQTGSLEAVQVSSQGATLAQLTDRINQARQHFAQVKTVYGPNYPEYRKASSELNELETQFEATRKNIGDRIQMEYREAVSRETMLKASLNDTKAESDQLNARSFQYQQLKREAEADKALYDELVRKIKEAGINAGFQNDNIRIADLARPGQVPVSPNVRLNTLTAFFLALLVAIGASVIIDSLNTTVRDAEQTSRYLGIDVIGVLPAVRATSFVRAISAPAADLPVVSERPPTDDNGYDRKRHFRSLAGFGEAIRTLRNTIVLGDCDGRLRSILMTSAIPGEGKTTVAAYLAMANAEQGRRTLVLDGDLRRPTVHRKFGLTPAAGFSDVLTGKAAWKDVVLPIEAVPNLFILPAGPPSHRAADLVSSRIRDLLDEFVASFDLVIVDGPPLLGFAEPLQMATAADGVLIIGKAGATERKALRSVLSALQRIRANVLGIILNQMKRDSSDGYSYYGYYHRYYSPGA